MKIKQLMSMSAASMVCLVTSTQAATNLISNGGFETPDIGGEFAQYTVGSSALTGWTITGNSAWIINGFDNFDADMAAVASDGDQFLSLQWNSSDSTVTQTIDTTIGQDYKLDFDYSAIDFSSRSVTLTYDVGGPDQTVTYTTVDLNTGQAPWVTETHEFTATATTTTISFTGDFFSGFWGTGIDSVSVVAVPEPSSAALLGLGGLALIFRRRK